MSSSEFKDAIIPTDSSSAKSDAEQAKASLEETFPDDFTGLVEEAAPPEDLNYFVTDLLEQMVRSRS